MAERVRGRQDDDGAAGPPDPPLRDHRDRQRQLALQEPRLTPVTTAALNDPRSSRRATPTSSVGPSADRLYPTHEGSLLRADPGARLEANRGSVALSADPSPTQTGASSGTIDLISTLGSQLTVAALAHGSSAPVVHNCSAV